MHILLLVCCKHCEQCCRSLVESHQTVVRGFFQLQDTVRHQHSAALVPVCVFHGCIFIMLSADDGRLISQKYTQSLHNKKCKWKLYARYITLSHTRACTPNDIQSAADSPGCEDELTLFFLFPSFKSHFSSFCPSSQHVPPSSSLPFLFSCDFSQITIPSPVTSLFHSSIVKVSDSSETSDLLWWVRTNCWICLTADFLNISSGKSNFFWSQVCASLPGLKGEINIFKDWLESGCNLESVLNWERHREKKQIFFFAC